MTLVKHSQRTLRKGCKRCGSTELYWAHDTDKHHVNDCAECGVNGAFVLIEKDGKRHVCGAEVPGKAEAEKRIGGLPPFPEDQMPKRIIPPTTPITIQQDGLKFPAPIDARKFVFGDDKKKEVSPVATTTSPDVQTALATLVGALAPAVDVNQIRTMVKEELSNIVFPTRTVIEKANGDRKELSGKTHYKVGDVITALMAEEHVLMVGPAGTGKSTIAEQAAEALGLPSYSISLSPQTPASQLVGYMQATGEYVRSLFRQAYENGGVFHFDEMDNAHPSVLAVINAALANGQMAFPDKMVKRHSDFRAVASANTYGRGADRKYVGRQAIDAATLDRFSVETVDVDESLENELCHSVGLETAQVERVLKFVRKVRKNVAEHSMALVISPRASMGMVRLLHAGRSWESAVEARVRRGMSDTEWAKVSK